MADAIEVAANWWANQLTKDNWHRTSDPIHNGIMLSLSYNRPPGQIEKFKECLIREITKRKIPLVITVNHLGLKSGVLVNALIRSGLDLATLFPRSCTMATHKTSIELWCGKNAKKEIIWQAPLEPPCVGMVDIMAQRNGVEL